MNKVDDRRQRAREAAQDAHGDPRFYRFESGNAVEAAVKVATQVKITDEVIEAAWMAQPVATREMAEMDLDDMREVVAAALTELGFEVVD